MTVVTKFDNFMAAIWMVMGDQYERRLFYSLKLHRKVQAI